ncbi:MAG: hypothetical protein OIF38_15610 [Cellvibrionaceae bacterium]|nr:hypothetical protein [Cellvibrionaceae bacterium]
MNDIDRTQYEQLDTILWDVRARLIRPQDALKAYERKWRYVDQKRISAEEQRLLDRLIREVGDGRFLPAT